MRLRISRGLLPMFEAVGKEIRRREPQSDFELRGPILSLSSENPSCGGELIISGSLDDRGVVKIRVSVDGEVYNRALRAHEEMKIVHFDGELVRRGQTFILQNPRNFTITED